MQNNQKLSKYYSRASYALKIARFCVVLIFVVFLLFCIFVFRDDITIDNIQYLMKYADFYDGADIKDDANISISATNDSKMIAIRDNLAVISRDGIGLYDFAGRKLFNFDFAYSSPAFETDGRNILVYDIKGTGLSIFNSFSRLYSQNFEGGVKSADINENGFAVSTKADGFRSVAIVYNSSYKEFFRWQSAERYITTLALSDTASRLLCCAVNSDDGIFDSKILIFDTNSNTTSPLHSISLTDEIPLKCGFSKDNQSIFVMTDSKIHFFNKNLEEISSYKYNQSKTESFYINDNTIIFLESNNLSGNSMSVIAFDYTGNQTFKFNCDERIVDICESKHGVFALSNHSVFVYRYNNENALEFIEKKPLDYTYKHILCDTDGRYILADTKNASRYRASK